MSLSKQVMIVVPCGLKPSHWLNPELVNWLLYQLHLGYPLPWVSMQAPVDKNRNEIVSCFLEESTCSHLLMIDSDMIPPTLNCVETMLEVKQAMVSLPAHVFQETTMKLNVYVYRNNSIVSIKPSEKIQKVDAVGASFLMCERKVFEMVEPPWFQFKGDNSEDIEFCRKAAQKGFKPYVLRDLIPEHFGTIPIGRVFDLLLENQKTQ